jgi:hypothetical protein
MIVRTDLRAGQGTIDLSALAGKATDYLRTANMQAEDVTRLLATAGVPSALLNSLPSTGPVAFPARPG